jgi:hypothetical protein
MKRINEIVEKNSNSVILARVEQNPVFTPQWAGIPRAVAARGNDKRQFPEEKPWQ